MTGADFLIDYLLKERDDIIPPRLPVSQKDKFDLYRGLVNIRPAWQADEKYLEAEDIYLKALTAQKGITDIKDLEAAEDNIYLWQGDITALKAIPHKDCTYIAQSDFLSDCPNLSQEY